jgi:hypothetical protein
MVGIVREAGRLLSTREQGAPGQNCIGQHAGCRAWFERQGGVLAVQPAVTVDNTGSPRA